MTLDPEPRQSERCGVFDNGRPYLECPLPAGHVGPHSDRVDPPRQSAAHKCFACGNTLDEGQGKIGDLWCQSEFHNSQSVADGGGGERGRPQHGDFWHRKGDGRIAAVLTVCGTSGEAMVSGVIYPECESFAQPLDAFLAAHLLGGVDPDIARCEATTLREDLEKARAEVKHQNGWAHDNLTRAEAAEKRGKSIAEESKWREDRLRERVEAAEKRAEEAEAERDGIAEGGLLTRMSHWKDLADHVARERDEAEARLSSAESELERACDCRWAGNTTGEEGPQHECPYHRDHRTSAEAEVAQLREALTEFDDPEQVAQMFHDAYERLAPTFDYETRRESAVAWGDVPEANRKLMNAVAEQVVSRPARAVLGENP